MDKKNNLEMIIKVNTGTKEVGTFTDFQEDDYDIEEMLMAYEGVALYSLVQIGLLTKNPKDSKESMKDFKEYLSFLSDDILTLVDSIDVKDIYEDSDENYDENGDECFYDESNDSDEPTTQYLS